MQGMSLCSLPWCKTDPGEQDVTTTTGGKKGHQLEESICVAVQQSSNTSGGTEGTTLRGLLKPMSSRRTVLGVSSEGHAG